MLKEERDYNRLKETWLLIKLEFLEIESLSCSILFDIPRAKSN